MSTKAKTIITEDGRQRLLDRLAYLEGEKHDEIVRQLQEARDFGDLSENSEYDAALDAQATNEAEIARIRSQLATAIVVSAAEVDDGNLPVSLSTTVELIGLAGNTRSGSYDIVSTTDTKVLLGKISNESPVGAAIMGRKAGDEVETKTPRGMARYLVASVTITPKDEPEGEGEGEEGEGEAPDVDGDEEKPQAAAAQTTA